VLVVNDDETIRETVGDLIAKWKIPVDFTPMASAMEALIDIHTYVPRCSSPISTCLGLMAWPCCTP